MSAELKSLNLRPPQEAFSVDRKLELQLQGHAAIAEAITIAEAIGERSDVMTYLSQALSPELRSKYQIPEGLIRSDARFTDYDHFAESDINMYVQTELMPSASPPASLFPSVLAMKAYQQGERPDGFLLTAIKASQNEQVGIVGMEASGWLYVAEALDKCHSVYMKDDQPDQKMPFREAFAVIERLDPSAESYWYSVLTNLEHIAGFAASQGDFDTAHTAIDKLRALKDQFTDIDREVLEDSIAESLAILGIAKLRASGELPVGGVLDHEKTLYPEPIGRYPELQKEYEALLHEERSIPAKRKALMERARATDEYRADLLSRFPQLADCDLMLLNADFNEHYDYGRLFGTLVENGTDGGVSRVYMFVFVPSSEGQEIITQEEPKIIFCQLNDVSEAEGDYLGNNNSHRFDEDTLDMLLDGIGVDEEPDIADWLTRWSIISPDTKETIRIAGSVLYKEALNMTNSSRGTLKEKAEQMLTHLTSLAGTSTAE